MSAEQDVSAMPPAENGAEPEHQFSASAEQDPAALLEQQEAGEAGAGAEATNMAGQDVTSPLQTEELQALESPDAELEKVSVSTPLPSPKRLPGPRPPSASPERWMALLKTDRAPVPRVTSEMVDTLKRQVYELRTSTSASVASEQKQINDKKMQALTRIEQLGGEDILKQLETESKKLTNSYHELQRLQRQASMKEARLLSEIAEKEEKWETVVKEMLEQYQQLEVVAEDRLQRKELLYATNQQLQQDLQEMTMKKDHFEKSLKAFVGRKATCAVCAYLKHSEDILTGYESKNEELNEQMTKLLQINNKQADKILEQRKQNELMEVKYKAMEHSCRHFRKTLEKLDEEIKLVDGMKTKISELESGLASERKRFLQYSSEVEPQLEQYEQLKPVHAQLQVDYQNSCDYVAVLEEQKSELTAERDQLTIDLHQTQEELANSQNLLAKTVEKLQQAKSSLLRNVLKGWLVNDDPMEMPRLIVQVWRDHLPELREDNRIWRLENDHEQLQKDHADLQDVHATEMEKFANLREEHALLEQNHLALEENHAQTVQELADERVLSEELRQKALEAEKQKEDFQFRLNQTCDQLEETEKQLHDLNLVFAARINKITELEDKVNKLRIENDRLWEHQGITVCDKHFLKPMRPAALDQKVVRVGEFLVEDGGRVQFATE
ncbi:unnamed protein product [Amoebophrya sp. A120]|nr:unnamed protein product [Amoebophrya sp. A120]|eukprot:GSA120T00018673001.1